jgi:hypothetical protein
LSTVGHDLINRKRPLLLFIASSSTGPHPLWPPNAIPPLSNFQETLWPRLGCVRPGSPIGQGKPGGTPPSPRPGRQATPRRTQAGRHQQPGCAAALAHPQAEDRLVSHQPRHQHRPTIPDQPRDRIATPLADLHDDDGTAAEYHSLLASYTGAVNNKNQRTKDWPSRRRWNTNPAGEARQIEVISSGLVLIRQSCTQFTPSKASPTHPKLTRAPAPPPWREFRSKWTRRVSASRIRNGLAPAPWARGMSHAMIWWGDVCQELSLCLDTVPKGWSCPNRTSAEQIGDGPSADFIRFR